jgi:hypothetical protein
VFGRMVKFVSKLYNKERRREGIDRLIETLAERQVGEGWWEGINGVVKSESKREPFQKRRKVINRFIKIVPERERSERDGEMIHELIEFFGKC